MDASYSFDPTVAALLSAPFCSAMFLPLEVLKSLDSKTYLTSHLVREHQCNALHMNTESCAVIRSFCGTGYGRSTRGSMRLLSHYFVERLIELHTPQLCSSYKASALRLLKLVPKAIQQRLKKHPSRDQSNQLGEPSLGCL